MKKNKYNMKKVMILVIGLLLIFSPIMFSLAKYVLRVSGIFNFNLKGVAFNSDGLVSSDIAYTDSKEVLLNPGRGYYTHHAIVLANPSDTTAQAQMQTEANNVKASMKASNDTLTLTIFYLNNYVDRDLTEDTLNTLNIYCDSLRQSGYKLIIRFAYFGDDATKTDPNDFNQILKHMEQLKPFFTTNKDVIHAVQLGFMGQWGEWHSSSYADTDHMNKILAKALEVIPSPIQILVRRPLYYKNYFKINYFDTKLGFTSDDKARVGIYDDGFLSTSTDYGTFETENREQELKWMDYLTRYTIFGGETIYTPDYTGYHDVVSAIHNMQKTHTNFLNRLYHPTIIDSWKHTNITGDIDEVYNGTPAYDYFKNKLGYRFVLNDVLLPGYSVKQGDYLHLSFDINNVGFGNLIYDYNVELIIEKAGEYYVNKTTIDSRMWFAGETTTNELVFKIPGNIEAGDWNVYLRLSDCNETLQEHENYYVKFANKDIWESKYNANYIGKFSVEEKENTTDNGFYQVNVVDIKVENETILNTYFRKIVIDGKKTTSIEWTDEDIVYNENSDAVYLYNDNEYLYIYTTSDIVPTNVDIRIATNAASSPTDYNYVTQNGSLYEWTNTYGPWLNSIGFVKDSLIEEKILLSDLGIQSVSDLLGMKVVYMDGWNLQKTFEFALQKEEEPEEPAITGMHVDGIMTHDTEYTSSDIFYEDDKAKVFAKAVDNYLYVYAEHSEVDFSQTPNVRLFLGSNDKTLSRDKDGFMALLDGGVVHYCTSNDCTASSATAYTGARGIDKGVEYKFPLDAINAKDASDILKLKINYMDSSWNIKQSIGVTMTEKIYPKDIEGRTVIFAKKPSSWSGINVFVFSRENGNVMSWPGEAMPEYVDGNNDTFAYILPDDSEYYVVFTDTTTTSNRFPNDKQNILRIQGKSRIWSGSISDGLYSWSYYNSSEQPQYSNITKFQVDGSLNKACVYLWDDATTSGITSQYSSWPGTSLVKLNGTWELSTTLGDKYSKYKLLFTDCNSIKYHQTDSPILRRGITVYGDIDSIWVIDD